MRDAQRRRRRAQAHRLRDEEDARLEPQGVQGEEQERRRGQAQPQPAARRPPAPPPLRRRRLARRLAHEGTAAPRRRPPPPSRSSRIGPAMKPPMWAKKATPPCWAEAGTPSEASPEKSWIEKPERQVDDRRHLDHLDEEAEEEQGDDPRPRVEEEVGAEDSRDRARGADGGRHRPRAGEGVGGGRGEAGGEIEDGEAQMAETVLDVVAEDPEEEHVAEEVRPAAMEEHREDGALDPRHQPGDAQPLAQVARRHEGRLHHERLEPGPERQLPEEGEGVRREDRHGDDRRRPAGVQVA